MYFIENRGVKWILYYLFKATSPQLWRSKENTNHIMNNWRGNSKKFIWIIKQFNPIKR
jgi:hypothetical protein